MADFNPFMAYGSTLKAMQSLINIAMLTEWTELVRPVIYKQPFVGIVFFLYVWFVAFGVMNVIVGMIVDSVMAHIEEVKQETHSQDKQDKLQVLTEIYAIVSDLQNPDDGTIHEEDLHTCWKSHTMQSLLGSFQLPRLLSANYIFHLVDQDGDGHATSDELLRCLFHLVDNDPCQQHIMTTMALNDVKGRLNRLTDLSRNMVAEFGAVREQLDVASSSRDAMSSLPKEKLRKVGSTDDSCRESFNGEVKCKITPLYHSLLPEAKRLLHLQLQDLSDSFGVSVSFPDLGDVERKRWRVPETDGYGHDDEVMPVLHDKL